MPENVSKARCCMALLAHVDAGKTTLSEAILYKTERIRKLGRVDKKDAFLDNYTLERERGITIFSKQATFDYGEVSFTLIDTPGHVDFSAEMERTLSVLDAAVLVISGTDGIQAHTRTLWKLLKLYDVPTFIFVNKMDREDTDKAAIQAELEQGLGAECVDFTTIDNNLMEQIALCDEELMESFLATGEISDEDIRGLIALRKLVPCMYGSALKLDGVDEFLQTLSRFQPRSYPEEQFAARVYKISRDADGNRLTHMKITGGALNNRDIVAGLNEKVTQLRIYSGEKYETVDTVVQGQVVAVLGLTATYPGQGLGLEDEMFAPQLVPVMTYRVVARDRSRIMQLVPKLRLLEEEDPSLNVLWNEELRELQIQVMGEIQLEIIKNQLLERFDEDVDFDKGSVLYKETVSAPTLGVGHFEPLRHYAEVQLLLEPLEPGSGISSESRVSTNDLELNWQRLIMTHIFEREHKGVLTGAVLTDVNISIVAGRAHQKHTEGGDFRQATYRAIRQGLMRARLEGNAVLLEPYYEINIELPRSCCGRAMTDIEKRHGRILSQYELGTNDMVGLNGVGPVATLDGYVKEVNSYTKGLGSVYCSFYGYLPCHNTEEVMAKSHYDPASDLRNPASSVFCAHGAGFVVEWYDVDSYKHLDWDPVTGHLVTEDYTDQTGAINYVAHVSEEPWIGTEEVDAIIERMSHANKRERTYKNPFRKHKSEKARSIISYSSTYGPADYAGSPQGISASGLQAGLRGSSLQVNLKERYLLVDGYNIIFAWPELKALAAENVDGARERLNDILCNYQALRGGNLIVVYDAYRVSGHPTEYFKLNNISVVYTKEAETADKFIERFAHQNAKQYDITVATSDGLEQIIIRGAGCHLLTANDLLEDVKRLSDDLHQRFMNGRIF